MPETTTNGQDPGSPDAPTRVLIVDDDEAVRDSLSVLLEAEGFEVATLESGERLVEELEGLACSVVLLDIRMPGICGMTTLQILRERAPERAVVMITGHGDVPMAVQALKQGAVDFLEKPFPDGRIIEAVRHAVESAHERRQELATQDGARARLALLTPREREIMTLIVTGLATKQVAGDLDISPRTVEIHRQRIMQKTKARSLAELVRTALAAGARKGR